MPYTISRLARRFKLARSTLLYYDGLGLLKPSGRSLAGYRMYSEEDARRLELICLYRRAGLALEEIGRILDRPEQGLGPALEKRLAELDEDIRGLRRQQHVIVGLLKSENQPVDGKVLDKDAWVAILTASGFTEDDMADWHSVFERMAPARNQAFLEYLGLPEEHIRAIRSGSQSRTHPTSRREGRAR